MLHLLKRLFGVAAENPPASEQAIARAEKKLGVRLPPSLKELYLVQNGVPARNHDGFGYRLMPLREVVRVHRNVRKANSRADLLEKYSMRCFFAGADFVGVFCGELFNGWLFFLHHDSMYLGDESPIFASVSSFQTKNEALAARQKTVSAFTDGIISEAEAKEAAEEFANELLLPDESPTDAAAMPVDFPPIEENLQCASAHEECRRRIAANEYDSDDEKRFLIYSAIRTASPVQMAACEEFLHLDDEFVSYHAPDIMCARDHSHVHRMFVRGARLEPGASATPLHHLLARMALRNPDSKPAILQTYKEEGRDLAEFSESLQKLLANPPIHF